MKGLEQSGRMLTLIVPEAVVVHHLQLQLGPQLDSEYQVIYALCDNIRSLPGSGKFG